MIAKLDDAELNLGNQCDRDASFCDRHVAHQYKSLSDELKAFIQSNPDSRELKRATAVAMFLQGYKHREIQAILSVSSGFISKWTQLYELPGVAGLELGHRGSTGYLEPEQRQAILAWLQSKTKQLCTEGT